MSEEVILYTSSTSVSAKMRASKAKIKHILTAKKVPFEEVCRAIQEILRYIYTFHIGTSV